MAAKAASSSAAPGLRVLCLSLYPEEGPSLRHRICAYREAWSAAGVRLVVKPFMTRAFYRERRRFGYYATLYKLASLAFCTVRLMARLWNVRRYDAVIIHREAFPLGGAWFERVAARLNARLIYDLDDAIWVPMPLAVNQRQWLWDPRRVGDIMAASRAVVVGNDYLRAYATRFNRKTIVVPTPYRDLGGPPVVAAQGPPVVVWIGNVGNEEYLEIVREALVRLARELTFVLRIVGSREAMHLRMEGVTIEALEWSEAGEGHWLRTSSVGIMPLVDRDYERGKCAFKIVQYFSAGLPVVASPVGMSADVVRDGDNGYLAATAEDWYRALRALLTDPALRARMGGRGYALYRDRFTVEANARPWVDLLRQLASEP